MAQATTRLKVPNAEAWVEIDGEEAAICGEEPFDEGRTVGFIESKAGSRFPVHCNFSHKGRRPDTDMAVDIYVDGDEVDNTVFRKKEFNYDEEMKTYDANWNINGVPSGKNKILPMVFNKMSVTDDVGKADTSELFVRGLGSIEVRLYRVKFVRETKPRKSPKKKKKKADSGPKTLRERSVYEGKEAAKLPHQAGLGAPIRLSEYYSSDEEDADDSEDTGRTTVTINFLDDIDDVPQPFAVFEFRYRSRDLLEINGLLPPKPTPAPEPTLAISQEDELAALRREVAELRSQNQKRPQEEDNDDEGSPSKKNKSGNDVGEGTSGL